MKYSAALLSFLFVFSSLIATAPAANARRIEDHEPSDDARCAMARAQKLMKEGKAREALQDLDKFVREEKDPIAFFILGTWHFRAGRKEKAVRAFEEAVRIVPGYPAAFRNLGKVYFSMGKHAEAAAAIRSALARGPAGADLLSLLGQSYASMGMNLSAAETFRRLLVLDPERVGPRIRLALSLLRIGDAPEAKRVCEASLEKFPGNAPIWELQANALLLQEKHDEAAEILDSLRRLGKAGPRALRTLGDLFLRGDLFAEAAVAYEASLADRKPDPEDLYRIALALREAGEGKRALPYCDRLIEAEPGEVRGHLLRARALAVAGKPAEAEKGFRKALDLDSDCGEAVLATAVTALSRGDMEGASRFYLRLTALKGFKGKGYAGLAGAALNQGRTEDALRHLYRALDFDPGNAAYHNLALELRKALREE